MVRSCDCCLLGRARSRRTRERWGLGLECVESFGRSQRQADSHTGNLQSTRPLCCGQQYRIAGDAYDIACGTIQRRVGRTRPRAKAARVPWSLPEVRVDSYGACPGVWLPEESCPVASPFASAVSRIRSFCPPGTVHSPRFVHRLPRQDLRARIRAGSWRGRRRHSKVVVGYRPRRVSVVAMPKVEPCTIAAAAPRLSTGLDEFANASSQTRR